MSINSSASRRFLAGGLFLTGVWLALPDGSIARALSWPLLNLAAAVAIAVALRARPAMRHAPWTLLLIGQLLYVLGDVCYLTLPVLLQRPDPLTLSHAFYLPAYLAFGLGLLAFVRTRNPEAARANLLDIAIGSVGLGLLTWVFLMAPYARDANLVAFERAIALSYPAMDILLFVAVVRLAIGTSRRDVARRLVVTFAVAQLAIDVLWSIEVLRGAFTLQHPVLAGYVIAWTLLGAAALHPSAAGLDGAEIPPAGGPRRRVMLLGMAALVPPLLLLVMELRGQHQEVPVLAIGTAVVFVLVLVRVGGLMTDVEWHRQLSAQLAAAEARYRDLLEHIPAVTYVDVFTDEDPTHARMQHIGPQVEELFGYTRQEWLAWGHDPWEDLVHPEDFPLVVAAGDLASETRTPFRTEYRMKTKDGRWVWVHDEAAIEHDRDTGHRTWRGVMYDITERKRADAELEASVEELRRLHAERSRLMGRLVDAQEEERTRIAESIHDDPLQHLTAVGLRLAGFRRHVHDSDSVAALGVLEHTVSTAIGRLRRLLFELRPRTLDTDGLAAALQQYLDELRTPDGPTYRLVNSLAIEPSPQARTVTYRIAQEALHNVQTHASATEVEVVVGSRQGGVFLTVHDDGSGVDATTLDTGRPGHLGISSMRERAEMNGGSFRLVSKPGGGTRVEIWLPDFWIPEPATDHAPAAASAERADA